MLEITVQSSDGLIQTERFQGRNYHVLEERVTPFLLIHNPGDEHVVFFALPVGMEETRHVMLPSGWSEIVVLPPIQEKEGDLLWSTIILWSAVQMKGDDPTTKSGHILICDRRTFAVYKTMSLSIEERHFRQGVVEGFL